MRIQCDTLKSAIMLKKKGIKSSDAEGLMSTLTEIEIFNLHSKREVDNMLSQSIERIFVKFDESLVKQDKKLAEQRREFDKQLQEQRNESKEQLQELRNESKEHRSELLASRRWTIGTIITVGLSLAAYLSALIHFNH